MSYEFYEGQMSGNLPAWNRLLYSKGGWKKPAHLNDGSPIGKDLSGGFYDAGGACGPGCRLGGSAGGLLCRWPAAAAVR